MNNQKIIVLANQLIGSSISSGGDVLSFQMVKRMKGDKTTVIAPSLTFKAIHIEAPNTTVINSGIVNPSTASTFFGGVITILAYVERSIRTYFYLQQNIEEIGTIYLTGDFFCNTVPTFLLTYLNRRRKINVLGNFFHINPNPKDRIGNPYLVSLFSRFFQEMSLWLIKKTVNTIFVLSEEGKQILVSKGFSSKSIVCSGAASDSVSHDLKKIPWSKKEKQVIYLGRINNTKGTFDLVEIFEQVKKVIPDISGVIVGGGSTEDVEKIKGLIYEKVMKNNVRLTGFVDEKEKFSLLNSSRCLVLPSREEGFGIVIMEALSLGIPVVCFDLPAIKLIYGKYSHVHMVPKFDKVKFAKEIIGVVNNKNINFHYDLPSWDDIFKIQNKYLSL